MTKTTYEVYRHGKLIAKYISETRNCEYMLKEIIALHYRAWIDDLIVSSSFKVVRKIGNEKTVIYTPKDKDFLKTEFDIV
jgi:hypothetical protein